MNTTLNLSQNVTKLFNENQQKLIKELCDYFLGRNVEAAKYILWKLCYRPDYLKELSSELYDSINENEDLSLKLAIDSIKEELRAQYNAKNPCFTFGILHKDDKVISGTKCNTVDGFACDIIYEKIENYLSNKSPEKKDIDRIIALLDNDEIRNYCGGLSALKFSREEISYIAGNFVTSNIATLVDNMYSSYSATNNQQATCQMLRSVDQEICSIPNIEPDYSYEKKLENITLKLPDATPTSNKPTITPSSVLNNADLIKDFYKSIEQVLKAGFSVEELISKRNLVDKLLEAASEF